MPIHLKVPAGFTFIELLVVLIILGIVSSFAFLAVGDFGHTQEVKASLSKLKQLVYLSEQEAILFSHTLGIRITSKGYGFYIYSPQNGESKWQIFKDNKFLEYHAWPKGLRANFHQGNSFEHSTNNNLIIVYPDGTLSPFKLSLKDKKTFILRGLADGRVI